MEVQASIRSGQLPDSLNGSSFLLDLISGLETNADSLGRLAEVAAAAASARVQASVDCAARLISPAGHPVVAASNHRAATFAQLEQEQGAGPITESLRSGNSVSVTDLAADPRWPAYGQHLHARGCSSLLALPITLEHGLASSLVFFAPHRDAFTPDAIHSGQSFAAVASQSLKLALEVRSDRAAAVDLRAALQSRTSIDIACGVIMAQNRCSYSAAFSVLAKAASHRNVKVRLVAESILEDLPGGAPPTHFQQ